MSSDEETANEPFDAHYCRAKGKPAWWFRIRRYYFALTIASRVIGCLAVVAAAIIASLLHTPILNTLHALENVQVPAYSTIRCAALGPLPCPNAHTGGLAITSRHHNGSVDISGRLHLGVEETDNASSSSSTLNVERTAATFVVLPGDLLKAFANSSSTGEMTLPSRVASAAIDSCVIDGRDDALTSLLGIDPMFSDLHNASWMHVASLECTPTASVVLFDSSGSNVTHVVVLCRCFFVPRPSWTSWMSSSLLESILSQQHNARWSLRATSFTPSLESERLSDSQLASVTEVVPESLTVLSDDSVADGSRVVIMSLVSSAEWFHAERFVTFQQVVLMISPTRHATSMQTRPIRSACLVEPGQHLADQLSIISAPLPPVRSLTTVATTPDSTERRWTVSAGMLVAVLPFRHSTQVLWIMRALWSIEFVSGSTGTGVAVAISQRNHSMVVLATLPLPLDASLCCGVQPLRLFSGVVTNTNSSISQGEQELFLLAHRACSRLDAQCSTPIVEFRPMTSPNAAYTSRMVAMKYSVNHNVLSAILPLSANSSDGASSLDIIADSGPSSCVTRLNRTSGATFTQCRFMELVLSGDTTGVLLRQRAVVSVRSAQGTAHTTSTSQYKLLRWYGGYRLDGIMLPSSAHCTPTGTGVLAPAVYVDVAIAGRLPLVVALRGGSANASVASRQVGSLVCLGPMSASLLTVSVASASGSRLQKQRAGGADFCFGLIISNDDFTLL